MADIGKTGPSKAYTIYFLILVTLVNTISYADRHVFSILVPAIKEEFDVSDSLLGILGGPGFMVSYILLSMPLARLADRWSRRGVLSLSIAIWSAATALCGAAGSIAQLGGARLLVGVGEAGGLPPSQSMLAQVVSAKRRSAAMGVLSSATYLGVVLGLTGGAAIAAIWDWRTAFYALAVPGIPLALLVWLTGPKRTPTAEVAIPGGKAQADGLLKALKTFWKIPSLRLTGLAVGVYNIFGYAAAVWNPAYFVRSHDMSIVEAGTWLGIGAAVGGVAGSMVAGVVVDRLRVRDEAWQLRLPALAYLLSFPALAVIFLMPNGAGIDVAGLRVPFVALFTVFTAFLAAAWAGPSFAAATRLVSPDQRAQAIALLVVIINVIGSVFGPVVGGAMSDLLANRLGVESLRYSLLALSILPFVGGLLFWRASIHYRRDIVTAPS